MGISTTTIVLTALVCLAFLPSVQAFGAGNVPTFSFLEGKAFRHGDIEDTLATLLKKSGGIFGGSKFGGLDIKHVYFGNWLRDYSQAMDIAGLQKLSKQTIINLLMGLGFLAHGYATKEFEVTEDRLGVYLPVEHIDNPSGYAADQGGDASTVDPRLRGRIDPRELEIDPATGMKNYIANENRGFDTSARYVRDEVKKCIEMGRRAKDGGRDEDLFEAYRLLGGFLHTLEDFTAHSNWCELSLRRLGYTNVFCHVGAGVILQTPGGPAPPLVTGTFGGADFLHSIMGEATDKISEASVSDLTKKMDDAKTSSSRGSSTDELSKLLFSLPSGGGELNTEMQGVQQIRDRAASGQSASMSPQELHATLWKVLSFRDNVVKSIESTIEKIPGLSSVVEKLTNAINKFIFTTLEPLLKPIMTSASAVLFEGSAKVLNDSDQYAVFDRMDASDPTHSFLAKDHFNNLLNEPAGKVSIVVISHAVKAVVHAWEEKNVDPNNVATEILEAFHHPYYFNDRSAVQREMATTMKEWINSKSGSDKSYILDSLTSQSVRNHKNIVKGTETSDGGHQHSGGCHGESNSILNAPVQRIMNFGSGGGIGGGQGYQAPHQNVNASHQGGGGGGGYPGQGRRREVGGDDDSNGGFQQQQGGHSQYSSGGNDYQQQQQQQPDYQQQQNYGQQSNQGYTPSYDNQQQQPQFQQQQQQYDQYGNPIQQHQQSGNDNYQQQNYSNQQGGGNYQQGGNGGYQQQQGGYGGGQSGY